jgi:hypothetical protein
MMETSKRTLVRKKINSFYGLKLGRTEFYKAVCGYNDSVLKLRNFSEAISKLSQANQTQLH